MVNIFKTNVVTLEKMESLFIQMTAKNCNQRCKHCYIDFPMTKNVKDFISIDKVKNALLELKSENLQCIYLTGAEPMTHPEFNSILRLCLKRTNVCICTNASFINEKKARFLKKVEDESDNEIIFKLSLDHYDELKNDELRGRGSFRIVINAVKSLKKYDFNPIIQVVNYYKEPKEEMLGGFKQLFEKIGISDINLQLSAYHDSFAIDVGEFSVCETDCHTSRILTEKGVYACPFLADDHRGWSGNNFSNYSKKVNLETPYCATCSKTKSPIFSLNYSEFM